MDSDFSNLRSVSKDSILAILHHLFESVFATNRQLLHRKSLLRISLKVEVDRVMKWLDASRSTLPFSSRCIWRLGNAFSVRDQESRGKMRALVR